jgi:hypothetical protein
MLAYFVPGSNRTFPLKRKWQPCGQPADCGEGDYCSEGAGILVFYTMKLQDFVTETLREIVDGVIAAQEYGGPKGARISPENLTCRTDQGQLFWDKETTEIATLIEFGVAVSTTEGTGTKGGVGVFVRPIALGSQGKSSAERSSQSRIKFTVPIHLPKT